MKIITTVPSFIPKPVWAPFYHNPTDQPTTILTSHGGRLLPAYTSSLLWCIRLEQSRAFWKVLLTLKRPFGDTLLLFLLLLLQMPRLKISVLHNWYSYASFICLDTVETGLKTYTQNEKATGENLTCKFYLFNIKIALPSDAFSVIPKSLGLQDPWRQDN